MKYQKDVISGFVATVIKMLNFYSPLLLSYFPFNIERDLDTTQVIIDSHFKFTHANKVDTNI